MTSQLKYFTDAKPSGAIFPSIDVIKKYFPDTLTHIYHQVHDRSKNQAHDILININNTSDSFMMIALFIMDALHDNATVTNSKGKSLKISTYFISLYKDEQWFTEDVLNKPPITFAFAEEQHLLEDSVKSDKAQLVNHHPSGEQIMHTRTPSSKTPKSKRRKVDIGGSNGHDEDGAAKAQAKADIKNSKSFPWFVACIVKGIMCSSLPHIGPMSLKDLKDQPWFKTTVDAVITLCFELSGQKGEERSGRFPTHTNEHIIYSTIEQRAINLQKNMQNGVENKQTNHDAENFIDTSRSPIQNQSKHIKHTKSAKHKYMHLFSQNETRGLKPLEVMFDQGNQDLIGILSISPVSHVSLVNSIDRGDGYRYLTHIVKALFDIVYHGVDGESGVWTNYVKNAMETNTKVGEGKRKPAVVNAKKLESDFKLKTSEFALYTQQAIYPIFHRVFKAVHDAYIENFISDAPQESNRGAVTAIPQKRYIAYAKDAILRPLAHIFKSKPDKANSLSSIQQAAKSYSILREILKRENYNDFAQLKKVIFSEFKIYKRDLLRQVFNNKRFIVHTTPVSIEVKLTLPGPGQSELVKPPTTTQKRGGPRGRTVKPQTVAPPNVAPTSEINPTFYKADYTLQNNRTMLTMNGYVFNEAFSAGDVGKWLANNESDHKYVEEHLTLACLGKYVADFNQFIYSFYMGFIIASGDRSANANGLFIMNYIANHQPNFKEGRKKLETPQYMKSLRARRKIGMIMAHPRTSGIALRGVLLTTDDKGKQFLSRKYNHPENNLRDWASIVNADYIGGIPEIPRTGNPYIEVIDDNIADSYHTPVLEVE